jgi:hypothetical protein
MYVLLSTTKSFISFINIYLNKMNSTKIVTASQAHIKHILTKLTKYVVVDGSKYVSFNITQQDEIHKKSVLTL